MRSTEYGKSVIRDGGGPAGRGDAISGIGFACTRCGASSPASTTGTGSSRGYFPLLGSAMNENTPMRNTIGPVAATERCFDPSESSKPAAVCRSSTLITGNPSSSEATRTSTCRSDITRSSASRTTSHEP